MKPDAIDKALGDLQAACGLSATDLLSVLREACGLVEVDSRYNVTTLLSDALMRAIIGREPATVEAVEAPSYRRPLSRRRQLALSRSARPRRRTSARSRYYRPSAVFGIPE